MEYVDETQASAEREAQEAAPVPADAMTYTGYPRRFLAYRWYKPLLVALLTGVFYLIFSIILLTPVAVMDMVGGTNVLSMWDGTYENADIFTAVGAAIELGLLATLIPALALAALIVKDRPFTSYSSARGGWDHALFFKCLAAAAVTRAVPILVTSLLDGRTGALRFTVMGLILCTLLCPLQCLAEEYVFRGLFMQTVGAWCRLPLLAVLGQTAVFVLGHPYNTAGKIAIAAEGVIFGLAALMARGLEAPAALHIANNMTAFYMVGFGFGEFSSELEVGDVLFSLITGGAYLLLLYFLGKKRGWFDRGARDDVTPFNEMTSLRLAHRAEMKEVRLAHRAERNAAKNG